MTWIGSWALCVKRAEWYSAPFSGCVFEEGPHDLSKTMRQPSLTPLDSIDLALFNDLGDGSRLEVAPPSEHLPQDGWREACQSRTAHSLQCLHYD